MFIAVTLSVFEMTTSCEAIDQKSPSSSDHANAEYGATPNNSVGSYQPLYPKAVEAPEFATGTFAPSTSTSGLSGRPSGIPVGLQTEWLTDSDVGLATAGASIKAPLLRGFGTPPPVVKIGFDYTTLFAAERFGLPEDLYEYSMGVSWVRQFSDRWTVRTMLGTAFATDHENTSSDAWQFRGGVFGIYERNDQWKWTIGAIALGRRDLPVLPAVGAIWTPTDRHRFDFTMPTLKFNYLLFESSQRQQWLYTGVGLSGTTWGYEKTDGTDDQLSYGDWRVLAGWESRPTPAAGQAYAIGRRNSLSVGYAFSRDFEFDNETLELPLSNSFLLRFSTSY